MHINDAGIALIESFEGCRLRAYPDPGTGGAPWTIGYGHTGPEVKPTSEITHDQAVAYLIKDLQYVEGRITQLAPTCTPNQFSAMVCLAYNIGVGNFKGSTLLKLHNEGKYAEAKGEFVKWDKAAGKVMAGLLKRREAEAELYGKE